MQIINKMVQCSECGCIAFPDAINCPKCGTSYRESKTRKETREIFEKTGCPSPREFMNAGKPFVETYHQLVCPLNREVGIITTVVIPSTKCQLCQRS